MTGEVGMSQNSQEGLFAMIARLWRAFVVLYWVSLFFFFPIFALRKIAESSKRRRASRKKEERTYWSVQLVQYSCFLYIAVCLYYHLFQDFLGVFSTVETQAKITWIFEFATGIPGFVWYFFTDRQIAMNGNATDFAVATLLGVLGLVVVLVIIDYLEIYGDLNAAGDWVPPARVVRRENEQFDREEAPYQALSKQWYEHKLQHPSNHPTWYELSEEQRGRLNAKWEAERAELWKKMEECPRASYFTQPR